MKKNVAIVVHTDFPWKEGMSYRVDNMARSLSKEYTVNVISPIVESSYSPGLEIGEYRICRFDMRFLKKISSNRVLFRFFFMAFFSLGVIKVRKKFNLCNLYFVQSEQQLALMPGLILSLFSGAKLIVDDVLSSDSCYKEHIAFFEMFFHAFERILLQKCSLIIASNSRIGLAIHDSLYSTRPNVYVIKNGVESLHPVEKNEITEIKSKNIFFACSMYSEQNRRAVYNLLEIFPLILKEVPDSRLIIVGGPVNLLNNKLVFSVQEKFKDAVQILGYKTEKDKEDFLINASVCVLPFSLCDSLMGGIRLKALDFLSYEKIVISTPTGVEGIDGVESGDNLIIARDFDCFKTYVIDALINPNKYEKIAKNGLILADKYLWSRILPEYLLILRDIAT